MTEKFGYRDGYFMDYISKQRIANRESAGLLLIPYDSLTKEQKKRVKIRLIIRQDGKCAICGQSEQELRRKLVLDHDHKTGKIRGLLCPRCNSMLGFAGDNPHIMASGIEYLEHTLENPR